MFLTVGSFVVLGLANLASANLTATNTLVVARSQGYGADWAMAGAIQQARYHGFPCTSFPKSGSFQVPTSGRYVYASCAGTPMSATIASGSSTLSSAAGLFVLADVGQTVTGSAWSSGSTTITGYTDANHVTVAAPSTAGGTVTVSVGTAGQRVVEFWACASGSPIATCNASTSPVITAVVLFSDTDNSSPPAPVRGYSATVESWVVSGANH